MNRLPGAQRPMRDHVRVVPGTRIRDARNRFLHRNSMTKYTCRFLTSANRIDDVEIFECATDEMAQERASLLLSKSPFPAVEVWELDRLVFRDKKAL